MSGIFIFHWFHKVFCFVEVFLKSISIKIPSFPKGFQGFEESEFSCTFAKTLFYQWFSIDFSDFDCKMNYPFAQTLCFVMLLKVFGVRLAPFWKGFLIRKGFLINDHYSASESMRNELENVFLMIRFSKSGKQ